MATWTSTLPTAPNRCLGRARIAQGLLFGSWFVIATGCATSRGTIGAVLAQRADGRLSIREVPPGLGAAQAGVLPGDEVLLIGGRDVRRMTAVEVHRELEGEVGQAVQLTLIRDGQRVVRVTLRRTAAPPRSGGLDPGGAPREEADETAPFSIRPR